MIVNMPGPDPLRGRVLEQRRAASMKAARTRRDMARARAKDAEDCPTTNDPEDR